MRCPFCSSENTAVKDSRPTEDSAAIRRRRQCSDCGARFTTFERVQLRELTIIKKSGRKVPFDRDKLMRSVKVATRKREIDPDALEQMISGVIRRLEARGETEVESDVVGHLVMQGLQKLDDVAFVRYASVYQNFAEAKDFEQFLSQLDDTFDE